MARLIKITRSSDHASLSVRPVAGNHCTWSSRSLTVLLSVRYRGVAEPGLRSTSPAVAIRVRVCRGSVLPLSSGCHITVFATAQCAIVRRTKRTSSRRHETSWAPVCVDAAATTAVTSSRTAHSRFRPSTDCTGRSFSITPNG